LCWSGGILSDNSNVISVGIVHRSGGIGHHSDVVVSGVVVSGGIGHHSDFVVSGGIGHHLDVRVRHSVGIVHRSGGIGHHSGVLDSGVRRKVDYIENEKKNK
jgi:hypothetical protein